MDIVSLVATVNPQETLQMAQMIAQESSILMVLVVIGSVWIGVSIYRFLGT